MALQDNESWSSIKRKFEIDDTTIEAIESDIESYEFKSDTQGKTEVELALNSNPNDLFAISNAIAKHYSIPIKAAQGISRAFSNKAKYQRELAKNFRLNLTTGTWHYLEGGDSNCRHSSLDGSTFQLSEGLLFNGEKVLPGVELGCLCFYTTETPDFNEPLKKPGLLSRLFRR